MKLYNKYSTASYTIGDFFKKGCTSAYKSRALLANFNVKPVKIVSRNNLAIVTRIALR
jgi:hypothetical protein